MTEGGRVFREPDLRLARDERGSYVDIDGLRFHVVGEAIGYLMAQYGMGRDLASDRVVRFILMNVLGEPAPANEGGLLSRSDLGETGRR